MLYMFDCTCAIAHPCICNVLFGGVKCSNDRFRNCVLSAFGFFSLIQNSPMHFFCLSRTYVCVFAYTCLTQHLCVAKFVHVITHPYYQQLNLCMRSRTHTSAGLFDMYNSQLDERLHFAFYMYASILFYASYKKWILQIYASRNQFRLTPTVHLKCATFNQINASIQLFRRSEKNGFKASKILIIAFQQTYVYTLYSLRLL